MMCWLTVFLVASGCLYCIILAVFICGFERNPEGVSKERPFVSVVTAARNEAGCIDALIQALLAQKYPGGRFELILVNDRSTDDTGSIMGRYGRASRRLRILHITETHAGMAPKKWALNKGIEAAKGDIILTTDADCVPPPGWIAGMISFFEQDVGLVAGFSPLVLNASGSLLHRFIALESVALAAVAAGSAGAGMPLTCSGRNLAYRKEVFRQIGGFGRIGTLISGDDDLLLHLVRDQTGWRIRYALNPQTFVPSVPARSMGHFSHQRRRHASKGFHYTPLMIVGLLWVYLFNAALVTALFFPSVLPVLVTVFGVKSVSEYLLLLKASRVFRQTGTLRIFPVAVCFHFIYVTVFGLWGQFGRFRWKSERTLKRIKTPGMQ